MVRFNVFVTKALLSLLSVRFVPISTSADRQECALMENVLTWMARSNAFVILDLSYLPMEKLA